MNTNLDAEISRMSYSEKILLVEEIWDQVAASSDSLTVPEAHKAESDRRLAADAGDAGRPWSEIRAELLHR